MLDTPYPWQEEEGFLLLCAQLYSPFTSPSGKKKEGYCLSTSSGTSCRRRNSKTMKTYKVHVVYGSREDIQALADILARYEIAFSFSGEYIYGSSPFDAFIKEHVPLEIATRLRPCVERWAESCINYEIDHNSESRFTIQRKGEKDIEVTAVPLHAIRFNKFLSDLVRKEEGIDYKVSWCANIGQEVDYTHN